MSFVNSDYLALLGLLVPLIALLLYSKHGEKAVLLRFISEPMFRTLLPQTSLRRWFVRSSLLLASCFFIILAVARPQFGVYFEETTRTGADIFVILDVSRSMLAEDVPPNRLSRAKSDLRDLVSRMVGDRLGLIVFAGKPRLVLPLTMDGSFYLEVLEDIDTQSTSQGGTAIGDAIRLAIRTFPRDPNRDCAILLLTDGEDHDSFPLDAAKEAAVANIKIFTVVLGDSGSGPDSGAEIPIIDSKGNRAFVMHDGKRVRSRPDTQLLQEIANITGGTSVSTRTSIFDLGQFYSDHLAGLKHGAYQVEKTKQKREQFQFFLVLAFISLTLYLVLPGARAVEWGMGDRG